MKKRKFGNTVPNMVIQVYEITRNYARSPYGVLKLADNLRQTTVLSPQLFKMNFKSYFYLVTGDKSGNQIKVN